MKQQEYISNLGILQVRAVKKCSKCRIIKPITEFHKHKNTKDRLQFVCKSCRKKLDKKYTLCRKKKALLYKEKTNKSEKEDVNLVQNKQWQEKLEIPITIRIKVEIEQGSALYE